MVFAKIIAQVNALTRCCTKHFGLGCFIRRRCWRFEARSFGTPRTYSQIFHLAGADDTLSTNYKTLKMTTPGCRILCHPRFHVLDERHWRASRSVGGDAGDAGYKMLQSAWTTTPYVVGWCSVESIMHTTSSISRRADVSSDPKC
ncbi:hypothetical protein TcWFU_009702 [Taenia crassiceps]|uniref:Uncharacterized protein n=1 Tax=Taenia crassiceps TaxID=6207 RepID=A0ABR4PZF3_9CEST